MSKTLITGATGDIGSKILEQCRKSNLPVRALSRRQGQVDKLRSQHIDAVVGDLTNVQNLTKLMAGCSTLLLNVAAVPDMLTQCQNAIDAAIKAGVKWIIKISASDARLGTNIPWVTAHYRADEYLREQAKIHQFEYTFVPASAFMSNLLPSADLIKQGFLLQSAGNGRCGWVDTQDIADLCHQLLLDGAEKHAGKSYFITGPKLITMGDIAAAMTRHVGHKVRYVDLPAPVFNGLLRMGVDRWQADGLTAQFNEVVRPDLEGVEVSTAMRDVVGREATSIDEWVEKNKSAFEGRDVMPYITGGVVAIASVVGYLAWTRFGST